jgi:hypothetical protein
VANLQSEIAEGQRKLVALAEESGKQRTSSLSKLVNGGLPDGAISLQVGICNSLLVQTFPPDFIHNRDTV